MSAEENERIVRRLYDEMYDQGHLDVADDLIGPGFVHHAAGHVAFSGQEGVRQVMGRWVAGFADMHTLIEDVVVEGDKVVVRTTWSGTHTGTMAGYAATGEVVHATQIVIYRLADGRIAEAWEE